MYRHHSVYMVSVQTIFSQANTEEIQKQKCHKGDEIMIYIQLFLSFCTDWALVSAVRCNSADSKPGCRNSWMAYHERIHESYHNRRNDTWSNRCQFCHIYRSADCWNPRCLAATFGSIFPSCILHLFWHLYIVNTKKLQQSAIFFPVCGLPLLH